MNNDIRYATKHLSSFFLMITLTFLTASGQSSTGVLKIFSENTLVVYVDEVHYPQYGEIKLAPGTHWVKAINSEGIRIYSQIVSVRTDEVTSVLIEAPQAQPAQPVTVTPQAAQPHSQGSGQSVVYGQTAAIYGNGQSAADDKAGSSDAGKDAVPATPAIPKPTIDIGQTGGKLPADMSGAFGLAFGMSTGDVDRIMSPKAAQTQRNTTYNVYAIPKGSSFCIVECRFIDKKLFQIIVGYVSTYTNKSKLKLSKGEVPVPEFNQMLNDVTAVYGSPGMAEKIFLSGYSEDDGLLLEALKKKKALLLYTWTEPSTGNNIMVGLGYTTAPLAATIYTSGPIRTIIFLISIYSRTAYYFRISL